MITTNLALYVLMLCTQVMFTSPGHMNCYKKTLACSRKTIKNGDAVTDDNSTRIAECLFEVKK